MDTDPGSATPRPDELAHCLRLHAAPELVRELRRLLEEAIRSSAGGEVPQAESSTALAEALCLAGMLRAEHPPGRRETVE